jgi:tetratricopeptide (TPR) repeat protein
MESGYTEIWSDNMTMRHVVIHSMVVLAAVCSGCIDEGSPVRPNSSTSGVTPTPGLTYRITSSNGQQDSDVVKVLYEPNEAHPPQMTSDHALQTLNDLLMKASISENWSFGNQFKTGWSATREGIHWKPSFRAPVFYPFKSIDKSAVVEKGIQRPAIKIGLYEFGFQDPNQRIQFADALFVLNRTAKGLVNPADEREEAEFEAAVKTYRSQDPKPMLSEEIRRLAIQAETAAGEEKYADAIDLYEQVLNKTPWWPKAHYNMAMLLAHQTDLAGAIKEMRRYLALAPEAPDARAAQDTIYQWEYKLSQIGK